MTKKLVSDLTIDDEYGIIESSRSVKEAALKMKELGIPDLVVVNDPEAKEVLGVIADFDIVTGLVAEDKAPQNTKVTDVMYTIKPVTLGTSVEEAFARMRDLDVPVVPVVDKNKLIGVVSIADSWGSLPDKYEDQSGLIPVGNPQLANFLFSLVSILLYLLLGIITPLLGISEVVTTNIEGFTRGDTGIWMAVTVYFTFILLLGIISTILILQWIYGDFSSTGGSDTWKNIGFIIGLVNIVLIVIMFLFFSVSGYQDTNTNNLGIVLGILGFVFLVLSVSREFVFKDNAVGGN